jgi:phage shock protein C
MAAHMPSRLYRSRSQKMIAGVSGGLGDYFDVDPVLIRLLFVVTAFISGVGILAYIVLWIVVPFEGDDSPRMDTLRRDFDDLSGRVREYVEPMRPGGTGAGRGTAATGAAASAAPGSPTAGSAASGGPTPGTATAEAGETSPAAHTATTTTTTTTTSVDDGDDDPLRRTFAYEEASMTSESATTSRLPAHYDSAASAIDPFGEPLPEGPPRISSSAPAAPVTTADAPSGTPSSAPYTQPGSPPAGSTNQVPPLGPPPFVGAAGAATGLSAPPDRRRRRQHWAGAILIILGLLFLGNNLGLLWWVEPEYLLPLILVGGGAWLLFGRGRRG